MSKKALSEKVQRMIQFLLALKKRHIARTLAGYGFKQATLNQGWALVHAVVGTEFDATPERPGDPKDLLLLDDWENCWFPITSATLLANFPAIHARVFLNLVQTEGPALVPSITTLLNRIDALESPDATQEDKDARALLTERGLTADRIKEARTLLQRLTTLAPLPPTTEEEDAAADAEEQAAEDAMWTFYKEWSVIARAAIKSRAHLKTLGFLQTSDAPKAGAEKKVKGVEKTGQAEEIATA